MSAARSAGQNYGGRFRVEHWRFDSRSRHQVARRCNGKNASRSYGVLRACPGGGRGAGRAGGRSGGWSGSDQGKERGRRGSGADGDWCTESSRSGCIRNLPGGGTGGHYELESITMQFGTEEIPRLRIEIGAAPRDSGVDYVLGRFFEEERPLLKSAIERGAQAIECAVDNGVFSAMNTFNQIQEP